jgi:2-oxoglutarate dehydrogenase E2 component (dihydrolipoamide succinyltransferase)
MAQIELKMPKMGESVHEATIIRWLKEEGNPVQADESLLEIATDKVDSEVPSVAGGTLIKKLFNEGDVVQVGTTIALIETGIEAPGITPVATVQEAMPSTTSPAQSPVSIASAQISNPSTPALNLLSNSVNRFYSPLVRNIAQTEGIAQSELDSIPGTGAEGRVTKKDILSYLERRTTSLSTPSTEKKASPYQSTIQAPTAVPQTQTPAPVAATPPPAQSLSGDVEIIEMDRMRKIIAEHMVMSKQTSPHVTSYVEVDVTNMVVWRERIKGSFEKREGEKITFTPIFIEAIARAIKDFPLINVSVEGTRILVKKNINIGMATALPSGNLIVPVIKNADRMNLIGLTKSVNELALRARQNKLQPDEIQGGTFTLTNVGSFGNVMGTPIINQPQVAIMAVGAIKKKPAVIETPQGDAIAIRHMMFLSMSYDHRVVDGSLGGRFIRKVADYLEQFDPQREI